MKNYVKGNFNNIYYNILSFNSIFLVCLYREKKDEFEIYYLTSHLFSKEDKKEFEKDIRLQITNFDGIHVKPFTGDILFYNLIEMKSNMRLASIFGFESNNFPISFRLVKDIDREHDPEEQHPYLIGYNSLNYDMTILALYYMEVFREKEDKAVFLSTNEKAMKRYSDEIYSPYFKENMSNRLKYIYTNNEEEQKLISTYRINGMYLKIDRDIPSNQAYHVRNNQINSGRHIDLRMLNEKSINTDKEKLLGMLGYRIWNKEIDTISKENNKELAIEEIKKTITYNCAIVLGYKMLFHDRTYYVTFKLRKQMINDYPEIVFEKMPGTGIENYKPDINSKNIKRDRITINSSSANIATACLCPYGSLSDIDGVSFLYPSKEKAETLGISQVNVLDETIKFIDEKMKPLVKNRRGQEIIDSLYEAINMYRNIEGKNFNRALDKESCNIKDFIRNVNVPYMDKNGDVSNCYVTFSAGGIHGAEYDQEAYRKDCATYIERKRLIKSGYDENSEEFASEVEQIKKPELFKGDVNLKKLNKKYKKTTFGNANHEDFISYYANLLINMGAFNNIGLGYNRYKEIYEAKEEYSKLMNDTTIPEDKRMMYEFMREGTKLILNSASGAADVKYDSPIRMNNVIISMRIIGQLFTWRIGQAQSLEGARVVSTNTDGLYTIYDEEKNAEILKKEAEKIYIDIHPELVYLVSKDANNRFEGILNGRTGNSLYDIEIKKASGGTLSCFNGPITTKSLEHPAIIDWGLAEFIKWKVLQGKVDSFDSEVGNKLLSEIAPCYFNNKSDFLRMFQNIICSNPDKGNYYFGLEKPYEEKYEDKITPMYLPKCNRIFYVNPNNVPDKYKSYITYLARTYIEEKESNASNLAVRVIKDINNNREVLITGTPKIGKVKGITYATPCMIINEELACTKFELSWLDIDFYNKILGEKYEENWKNKN